MVINTALFMKKDRGIIILVMGRILVSMTMAVFMPR